MPRALLLLALTTALALTHAAEVFVIADTANQTRTITDAAKETIAEANNISLHLDNDALANPEDDHEPVVRKKRTFGDVVFRGLADVLGYNVARKPPQVVFPPPLAPVPGIDAPLQAVAFVPVVAAPVAPQPQAGAPAPCGRAVPPCAPPPPPPPKPTQPPCPRPRANPKPRPKPRPRPSPPPPPPPPPPPAPPCARPRANPTTAAPCAPAAPPPAPPKADSNLETVSSNFRLDFNFNRSPASAAPAVAVPAAAEEQETEQEQEQIAPVAIQPRAAKLPQDPPRKPRVYLDAFVVRNGVAQRVHTVDAQALNRPQADDDYLVYDDEQPQQNQDDDDYEYVQESRDRAKAIKEFGTAVDRFWEQKQKPKIRLPANDYRNVHFGDRNLANQILQANEGKMQSLQKKRPKPNSIPLPLPKEEEEDEDEITTTTQDPRKPLKPRVLPPTEHNPNQIDTVTVRVPPIYKEKRPKKLHRGRTERPDRDEDEEEAVESSEEPQENYDSDTENSSPVEQTEPPRRKRRRKNKRRVRSVFKEAYSAGDYDYYGKKIPMSKEEEFFRGLTIPPPTKDADLARLEEGEETDTHFLDDHERLREDPEKIKTYDRKRKNENDSGDEERADESERSDSKERAAEDTERAGEIERADETERSDRLSPNAKVHETGYQNQYVRASNVQVDDPNPLVATVKRKSSRIPKP